MPQAFLPDSPVRPKPAGVAACRSGIGLLPIFMGLPPAFSCILQFAGLLFLPNVLHDQEGRVGDGVFVRSLDQVPEAIESYKRAVWHQAADSGSCCCNSLQQETHFVCLELLVSAWHTESSLLRKLPEA